MEDIESPGKPEQPEINQQDKYEFNLGLYRIETLSKILTACAKKYQRAITSRDIDDIQDYQAMVNTLYTETFIYMENETNVEIMGAEQNKTQLLKDYLDDFDAVTNTDSKIEHLQQVRSIYLAVRGVLQEAGIDIPKKETVDPNDTFREG